MLGNPLLHSIDTHFVSSAENVDELGSEEHLTVEAPSHDNASTPGTKRHSWELRAR